MSFVELVKICERNPRIAPLADAFFRPDADSSSPIPKHLLFWPNMCVGSVQAKGMTARRGRHE
jgi:hypothetical protein